MKRWTRVTVFSRAQKQTAVAYGMMMRKDGRIAMDEVPEFATVESDFIKEFYTELCDAVFNVTQNGLPQQIDLETTSGRILIVVCRPFGEKDVLPEGELEQ